MAVDTTYLSGEEPRTSDPVPAQQPPPNQVDYNPPPPPAQQPPPNQVDYNPPPAGQPPPSNQN